MYCTGRSGTSQDSYVTSTVLCKHGRLGAAGKTPKSPRRQRVQYYEAEVERFGVLYVERIGSERDELGARNASQNFPK
jgi:hypothetical protein